MNLLFDKFNSKFNIEDIHSKLKSNLKLINFTGCINSSKACIFGDFKDGFSRKIILCRDEINAKNFLEEIRTFVRRPIYYPETDLLFGNDNVHNNVIEEEKMSAIREIVNNDDITIVTTISALLSKVPNISQYNTNVVKLETTKIIDYNDLVSKLSEIGYTRVTTVDESGSFAIRGEIIDIFPVGESSPIRIDFFDNEIESIKYFDTTNQRSFENIDKINIYPLKVDSSDICFLDYFDTSNTLIYLDEPNSLVDTLETNVNELSNSINNRINAGENVISIENRIYTPTQIIAKINNYSRISMNVFDNKVVSFGDSIDIHNSYNEVFNYNGSLTNLTKDINKYLDEDYRIIISSSSTIRIDRLKNNIEELSVNPIIVESLETDSYNSNLFLYLSNFDKGFIDNNSKLVLITENDIFGNISKKRKNRNPKYSGEKISHFTDLNVGDLVVHEKYGIGRYKGIKYIENSDFASDFMSIEYKDGDILYIPVIDFGIIQKYSSSSDRKPTLSKIGSKKWIETKHKVNASINEIAKDLVKLYANRSECKGYSFGEDTVWQKEFEESFPFEETNDQLVAIEDVKRDMQSNSIMDRLICGDVGYGKTEIALRASFKAVQDNKQVAYLVPTTILAKQHYDTFAERFSSFPVTVELLSRYKTIKEQKDIIHKLESGKIDIVIGTHRLLSQDVKFKDLGLLVIDEEQRFGVKHKEVIKKLKSNIDVLTLSATPIPRTLHMSLLGIRQMSVLEEPPRDRMAIQTYVMEYNNETVREAILREINRGGQVYYVYNQVKGIQEIVRKIRLLVPGIRIDYAHGQMNEKELDNVMFKFVGGEIDVLVSTTIIETGLDIPNVNTMIIHNADRMGLSQLYQLRGRVGRSNRSAYCFLLTKTTDRLSEDAVKRLEVIREFTALGSGFKIAMKDLEIRGAGNMLGKVQSGHMSMVGYDLYCKMLAKSISNINNDLEDTEEFNTNVDIKINGYIPSNYIEDEKLKLDIYKDISLITNPIDKNELCENLEDRFGRIPINVIRLMEIALIKHKANNLKIINVSEKNEEISFTFDEKSPVDPSKLIELINSNYNNFILLQRKNPILIYKLSKDDEDEDIKITNVNYILDSIS